MDREHTPQKQRQKRSSSNRRTSSSSTGSANATNATNSRGAFRGVQRPRSRTATSAGPSPSVILSKTPSMLLRPPGASSGVLYEPDANRRRHSVQQDRDKLLQVHTRPSSSSGASPGGRQRPPTVHQSKIIPPVSSVKLITPQMQFATDLSMKLGDCLELSNLTVVGVLGLEGVGKSTLLSLLAQKEIGQEEQIFSTRSLESLVLDRHETTGVDLAVSMLGGSGHPTILLDSQPMMSSSMLADLLERNESQRFGALTPEQQVEVASFQIAVFLFAICHYVVVVHDGLAFQVSVNDLLRKIEHKFAQCRLPSVSGTSQKHAAQLLYVANNVAASELLYRENELFTAHERALEAAGARALVRVPYKLSSYSDPPENDTGVLNAASFVLPHNPQQLVRPGSKSATRSSASPAGENKKGPAHKSKFASSKYADFDEAAEGFQRFVLSLPSSPSFTSQTTTAPRSKSLPPPHALSLREWLSNASRVFEGVRKASCFTAEYTSGRDHH